MNYTEGRINRNKLIINNIRIKSIKIIKKIPNIKIKTIKVNINRLKESINNINQSILFEIEKLLHNIGMRDNLLGYYYYLDSIIYTLISDNELDKRYMSQLYENEMYKFKKNIHTIERNMRYVKESSWKYNSHVYIENILGYSFNYKHNVPTNMELILALTECIRITIGY